MRAPRHSDNRDRFELRLAPMIDVVFLLLVFFVCTASFRRSEYLLPAHINPGAGQKLELQHEPVPPDARSHVVMLETDDGRVQYRLDDKVVSELRDLTVALRKLAEDNTEVPVVLDISPDVPVGDMIRVYDTLRELGFGQIKLAAAVPL